MSKLAKELEDRIVPTLKAKHVSQALLDELKAQRQTQYQSFKIFLQFDSFYEWLATTPEKRMSGDPFTSRGFANVETAISQFRGERNRYIDPKGPVATQLDLIMKLATGKALMNEINRAADVHFIYIRPDTEFRYTGKPFAGVGTDDPATLRNVTALGMPVLVPEGNPEGKPEEKPWQPLRDQRGVLVGSGTGTRIDPRTGKTIHGDNAVIEYTPEPYERGKSTRPPGAGMDPDEVLFHELVHATRWLRGVSYVMPVDRAYDNEEEYLAIVLTNIYLRNKKDGAMLRGAHDPRIWLPVPERFLDNVQHVNLEPRMLLWRFGQIQIQFFRDLAAIDPSVASFNPVRQYDLELARLRATRRPPRH